MLNNNDRELGQYDAISKKYRNELTSKEFEDQYLEYLSGKREIDKFIIRGMAKNDYKMENLDISMVSDLSGIFYELINFNDDITKWDTSNVTNMAYMFYSAEYFNQNINSWSTNKVTNMSNMFCRAKNFDQPLNSWDVSNVENMSHFMYDAISFNQPLNNWDVSKVTTMEDMFGGRVF
jgi:surface protein